MLNEFYKFLANRIFQFFQIQSSNGLLRAADSFCLKLDDDEMVQNVQSALESILEENNAKGLYEYHCMDGSIFRTSTMRTNSLDVIIAAQNQGMTSDFLGATLRNAANEDKKPLLMITSNPIDSALSGSRNMSSAGMPFYPEKLIAVINEKITDSGKLTNVEKAILKFELDRRENDVFSDKTSLYEYRELLAIISSGSIEKSVFPQFRLFYVDGKNEYDTYSDSQIRQEIKQNHDLFERIDRSVRFGNIESDLASDFDDKFIRTVSKAKNDNPDQWSVEITYNQVKSAKEKQNEKKEKPLQIEKEQISAYRELALNPYAFDSELFIRDEGNQKAKKRTKNILIFNADCFKEVTLRIDCNIKIPNSGIQNESESFERENKSLIFKFEQEPLTFRKIEITDEINKITYVFKICIISISPNYLIPTIKTNFAIEYKKKKSQCRIKLLGIGTDLTFNQGANEPDSQQLEDHKDYECDYKTRLNLFISEDDLLNISNGMNISVSFASISVPFTLYPDEVRSMEISGRRILRDKFAHKSSFTITNDLQIQRDSQEYFAKEDLQRELYLERCIVQDGLFAGQVDEYHNDRNPEIVSVDLELDDQVKQAYIDYLNAFKKLETVPTLAYLGEDSLRSTAEKYVETFVSQFTEDGAQKPLSVKQENSLLLGSLTVGDNADEILLTPLHPLNVAYQLTLLKETGFEHTSDVIVDRLSSIYLLPYIQRQKRVYKVSDQMYSLEWRHYAPVENRRYMGGRKYVPKLIEDKVQEFTSHFRYLFDEINNYQVKINLINMGDCKEVLHGIAQYYCHAIKRTPDTDKLINFEIHVYTEDHLNNSFNYLKDRYKLKDFLDAEKLTIDSGTTMNDLEGILTKKVMCYFHKDTGTNYEYAHITFYEMESEITSEMATMDQIATGVSLGGILSGVPSGKYGLKYRTGFGSKYAKKTDLENVAELFNALSQVSDSGNPYHAGVGISTQIDSAAENKMKGVYESSNWVVFVDPKVDLDFFCENAASSGLLIIHYSDQYTSSSGYDAITVTQKANQYSKVIQEYLMEKGVSADKTQVSEIINLFNAINGDWLLRLVSSKKTIGVDRDSTFSREKISIVAAIKLMLAYLKHPEILWVPVSMEEMLRVSGSAGLSRNDSVLSAKNLGFEKGPTSDDLLFIGLHNKSDGLHVYFYPTEVKTGNNNAAVIKKAFKQASSTADGLTNAFTPEDEDSNGLTYKVNRNFMMQMLINSCKKMQVYHVDDTQNWNIALDQYREQLLNEEYMISTDIREAIGKGAVLSFKKIVASRKTSFKEDLINFIEVPEKDEYELILKPVEEISTELNARKTELHPLCQMNVETLTGNTEKIISTSYQDSPEESETGDQSEYPEETKHEEISKDVSTVETNDELLQTENNTVVHDEKIESSIRIQFGTNRLDGSDVIWNPNDTDQVFHTNTGIIGTMGTGKTQFTKSLITQLYQKQSDNLDGKPIGILIFDYKGDYNQTKADFVKATDATILQPYHLPFNPLALTKSIAFKPLLPIHTANAFKDTLTKINGLGPKQQDSLFQCILSAYHQCGIQEGNPVTWDNDAPTFETVYQVYANDDDIKKSDSLASAMNKLHNFQVFESDIRKTKSLYELLQGVVVIDISGYDPDIQSLIVAITLDLFYAQMQASGSSKLSGKYRQISKMILVDEADNFMSQDFSVLKKILKEGREFGVGTILSTQFLKHFGTDEDDYSKYILTWVVHNVADLKAADVDFVFNTDSKSSQEQKLFNDIKHLKKHNSIVKIGNGSPVYIEDLPFWKLMEKSERKN